VSEGDYNAFGWSGEPDLRAALAFLRRRPDVDPARIGGLGLSVGGELLLQTAAHTRALRAVVSEGAGQRSLAEHLDIAGISGRQAFEDLDGGGLAGAVGPQQAEALAATHLEIEARHGHDVGEALDEAVAPDCGRLRH